MTAYQAFPKTRRLECDVLKHEGLPISCKIANGGIYPALSAVKIEDGSPAGVKAARYIKKFGRTVCLATGGIYYTDLSGAYLLSSFQVDFASPFFFESDGGDVYLVGDTQAVIFRSDRNAIVDYGKKLLTGATKNGRLFAVDGEDKFKLRWSGTGGGGDWAESVDGAGSVNISGDRGEILDIIVYRQKLVLLCSQGLVVFNAYGNTENFKLQYIDGRIENIAKGSGAVADGKLMFCSDDGIYSFDGVKAEKLWFPLFSDMQSVTGAAGFNGDYFVTAMSRALGRKVVYVFNIADRTAYIIDLPANVLYERDGIRCFTDNGHYELKRGGAFKFTSGAFDFGTRGKKALISLHLGNESPADITVLTDERQRSFTGVKGYCRPKLRGKKFNVFISGQGEINGVKAVAEAGYDV